MSAPTRPPVTPSEKEERTFLERLRDALQGKSSKQVEPVEEDDVPYYFV